MKLDKTHSRIIFELDRDSRASAASIARKLRLPEETIRYRLNALIEEGVISTCYPVIEAGLIGMSIHKLMFKLQKAGESEIERLAGYIRRDPRVNWAARFDGNFDLGCTLWIGRTSEVTDFIEELRKRFHNFIKSFSYAVNVDAEFYPRDYLVQQKRSSPAAGYSSSRHPKDGGQLDGFDWKILRAIAEDARTPVSTIGQDIGLAGETVQRRLLALEKKGIVSGYRVALDHEKAGVLSYYILLYLNYAASDRLSAMLRYLRSHPNVVYMIKMLGQWDYDLSVELPDAASYRAFMLELTRRFSDVIRDSDTLTTWKVMKFGMMPTGDREGKEAST